MFSVDDDKLKATEQMSLQSEDCIILWAQIREMPDFRQSPVWHEEHTAVQLKKTAGATVMKPQRHEKYVVVMPCKER